VVEDDLIGQLLSAPTLYELTKRKSHVSMLSVHRGATLYTTVAPSSFTNFLSFLIKGTLKGIDAEKSFSAALDDSAVQKLIEAIDTRGLPDLQVVYLPGIDIFTHVSENRLESQARYLQYVTDKRIGDVLDAYRKRGALDGTYVIIISDHSQIPTLNDTKHKLGTDAKNHPSDCSQRVAFACARLS
jgi:predicted AlkP superfamily pyrophosphatase or phosphodiesterase